MPPAPRPLADYPTVLDYLAMARVNLSFLLDVAHVDKHGDTPCTENDACETLHDAMRAVMLVAECLGFTTSDVDQRAEQHVEMWSE